MVNTHKLEENKSRAVKRGKQGERTVRPNNERFTNTQNFELQFRAFSTDLSKRGGSGGKWLGNSYVDTGLGLKSIDQAWDGILAQQKIWVEQEYQEIEKECKVPLTPR